MLLGHKLHTAGNTRRYKIDYSNWLEEGESLSSGTVVIPPGVSLPDITLSPVASILNSTTLLFTMSGGSANEAFTLNVQIIDSRSEVKNDTVGFTVVAP